MEDFATTVTFQTVLSAAPSTIKAGRLWPNESFIVTLYLQGKKIISPTLIFEHFSF
jgi:hypothetical protein